MFGSQLGSQKASSYWNLSWDRVRCFPPVDCTDSRSAFFLKHTAHGMKLTIASSFTHFPAPHISDTVWPLQAAAAVAAAAAFSNVSSSSLQKKSLGANYSHKWSPAVEYKAWNVDFQLSFHLKLRKSACSINSLDPPPLKSYFPDFFFFTSQHAHLCRSSAAMSLQRYLPPKIHQDSLFTSSLISEKKEELLQSRAWFVMFIACQPAWVALNDATLHLRWFCIEHCVNWMNFKIQLLLFLPLFLVSLLHSSSLFDFALITSCREITSNLLELLNFGFFFQDKRKLNIFKILLEFKTSKFSNFHNLFLKYDSYWAFGHDVTHEDTFRSIYFVVNSLTQRIMSEYAYRVWANSR